MQQDQLQSFEHPLKRLQNKCQAKGPNSGPQDCAQTVAKGAQGSLFLKHGNDLEYNQTIKIGLKQGAKHDSVSFVLLHMFFLFNSYQRKHFYLSEPTPYTVRHNLSGT